MKRYILDANFFIEAMGMHYYSNIFPGFWKWLESEIARGTFIIIDKVYDELSNYESQTCEWLRDRNLKKHIVKTDDLLPMLKEIKQTVSEMRFNRDRYSESAINEFFKVADSSIVAYALKQRETIVSNEKPGKSVKSIKIPDVCKELGLKHIYNHQLLPKFNPIFDWDENLYNRQ